MPSVLSLTSILYTNAGGSIWGRHINASARLFVGGLFNVNNRNMATGLPELTKFQNQCPHIRRGEYAHLTAKHVQRFTQLLGSNRVLTDEAECQGYNVDWIKNVRGYSKCVLKPKTTEEVSKILSYCNTERLAVCPQGGNTGLVGGSVPVFDEIVLSTALMNEIISLDETSGVLVCQAGCILETLENYINDKNLIMPFDLGAKGSCHIGGNISTNAGGLRLLRYGNLHGSVLGLEAVKANGEIIDCLNTLKKDNTGYHLKHLFIGSEGTLGIVTKVAIHCPTKPKAVSLAFLALDSFEKILETFKRAKLNLGEVLSSCEMADAASLDCVTGNLRVKSPLGDFPFYMLIETSGSNGKHDEEKLNYFLEDVMQDGTVLDGTVTSEPGKMQQIWQLRERIAEGLMQDGYVLKYDISFQPENFYSIIPVMNSRLGSLVKRCCGYGHIGSSKLVLRPKSTEEVSKILSFCNKNQLAVCPQGGNTSVSGGSIAVHDEIILSLSLMNNIIDLDDDSDVLICEAGCILENLENLLNEKNLMMPVDLASKGSCQIGGNVATNAGGLKVLRYGSMHGSVLGLEVVKANGEIIDCLNTLKKDNSGYHLKHLFIGSEGTLGIITKVAIKCVTLPRHYSVAFLGLDSFDNVLKTFKCAKQYLNESLSACEMMDFQSMDMVQTHLKLTNAIGNFPFYMLIELSGANSKHNEEKLNAFIETAFNEKFIVDGTFTCDPSKSKALWEIRERFAESMKHDGFVLMYDLSFRLKDFYTLVPEMTQKLGGKCERVSGMGHLGDGNLHLQISLKQYDEQLKKYIDDVVYKRTQELKGSISAEHGIGFLKTDILHYSKSESAIKIMRQVKEMMDPNWILNPYKILLR